MQLPTDKLLALFVAFLAVGLVAGTGAFTTVSAQRTATVSVAGDDAALLGLQPGPGGYAELSDGTLELTLDDTNLEATTTVAHVFTVVNNGQDEVALQIAVYDYVGSDAANALEGTDHVTGVDFLVNQSQLQSPSPSADAVLSGESSYSVVDTPIDVGPGQSVHVALVIDTTAVTGLDADGTDDGVDLLDRIEITADADAVDDDTDSSVGNLDATSN